MLFISPQKISKVMEQKHHSANSKNKKKLEVVIWQWQKTNSDLNKSYGHLKHDGFQACRLN